MAKVLISNQYLEDIADAIRVKNETNNTYTPAQMASAILALNTVGVSGTIIQDDDGYLIISPSGDNGSGMILADNCKWGISTDNSAYSYIDENDLEFGGS